MRRVFADTSYWIALLNPRDELHEKAVTASQSGFSEQLVTSEMVLTEVLNSCSARGARLGQAAAKAVEAMRASPSVVIVPQTGEQFEKALQLYKDMSDKSWSFTDCASISIMAAEGIHAALTHDKHFAQAGFEVLLR
ncbi:MAG: PIN domain-containing protein [Candidatus Acidiferrales bacterium]